jgi:hypothetical protein
VTLGQDTLVLVVVGVFLIVTLLAVARHGDGAVDEPPTLNTRNRKDDR